MGTEIGVVVWTIAGGGHACGDLRQKSLNLPWWAMVLVIVSGAQEAQAGWWLLQSTLLISSSRLTAHAVLT